MATPVGRIEKEFLFNALFEEKIPLIHIREREEFIFKLNKKVEEELVLRTDKPLPNLKQHMKLQFKFNYRGQVVDFTSELLAQKDELITCKAPTAMYKNLDRNFLRVDAPSDIKILFTFRGERYNLAFPKISEYETITANDLTKNVDPRNLTGLIKQIASLLGSYADGYKIVNFKEKKPETLDEKIVSESGKILFIPSTTGPLPKTDPYPKKRIITEEMFHRYLETTGIGTKFLEENTERIIKNKLKSGIYSEAWIPILFHEYVIGYIRIWNDKKGKPPLDFSVLDNVYQYAKVLAFGLKENGYFEHGKVENRPFEGRVLDISASGLMFAYPLGSSLLATLLVDSELTVTIETKNRSINVLAKIVRKFKDKNAGYLGCRFIDLAPEDMRFLYEHLYGKQVEDEADSEFLTGQV